MWHLCGSQRACEGSTGLPRCGREAHAWFIVPVCRDSAPVQVVVYKVTDSESALPYKRTFGLPIHNIERLDKPLSFRHPKGAVGIVKFRA